MKVDGDRHSQKVAICFRGHDKPRRMGVAIAIYFPGGISHLLFFCNLTMPLALAVSGPRDPKFAGNHVKKGTCRDMHGTLRSSALEKNHVPSTWPGNQWALGFESGTSIILQTSWWFQLYFIFTPNYLGNWSNLNHIFQMGWFNHQLAKHVALLFRVALGVVRIFGWLSSNLMTRSHFDGNMDPAFFEQSDSTTEPSESRYVSRKGLLLRSSSEDGIGMLNSILGRGLDS